MAIFQLLSTPSAGVVIGAGGQARHQAVQVVPLQPGVHFLLCMYTLLTKAVFPGERNTLARGKRILASSTGEAFLVKSVPQGGHHLALNKLVALGTLGSKVGLIAFGAIVTSILREEPTYDAKHFYYLFN